MKKIMKKKFKMPYLVLQVTVTVLIIQICNIHQV